MKNSLSFYLLILSFNFSVYSQQHYDITVSKDGSGDFTTIQEAIDYIPHLRKKRTFVLIKNGTYKEKIILPSTKAYVSFIGEHIDSTIICYDDYASSKNVFGESVGTSGSTGFYVFGPCFEAENITFSNTAGPVGQAVAVRIDGDMVVFRNCKFLGFQDTLYLHGEKSRQYYINCYIEGTVDFIFGWSTAVFDSCTIFCKNRGYITAASTQKETNYGFIFRSCNITGDSDTASHFLGRPWRPYAKTVFLHCFLDKNIRTEGWDNWRNPDNEKTLYYAEYKNYGPGSNTEKRVSWSHQLTDEETEKYTLENIFGDWNPCQNNNHNH